ncbi:hypothetical protein [Arthrobacter sp. fls2-241-R2A-200]|uniref:hypothetical protein n=1 Tax=Arthrobacter sp. fls2-241-R2A-200 TaxID=3040281 RepID=UPI00254A118D|nr:hypothetical protein [Arthrobacter sp. fls2-241-R2A-200]
MDDPTTLAINLTYFGTLGLAVLMFLGLVFVVIITLVVAGIGRLLAVALMALIGIFPKKANTPIVHLPPLPERRPGEATADVVEPAAPVTATPTSGGAAAAAPKRDLWGAARRRLGGASAPAKDTPALAKDWADAVAEAKEREAARAKAGQPPAIKVTVREIEDPTPPSTSGKTPTPAAPDVPPSLPGNGGPKAGATPRKGKSSSAIRKGSLSGASRNS